MSSIAFYALHNVVSQVMSIVFDSGTFRVFGARGSYQNSQP